jgi:2'-5' RNA ligase
LKHRLFLAIDIPPQLAKPISELQSRLEKLALPIKWEPEEKLHLTLNFIGKIDEEKQSKIESLAGKIASDSFSFSLSPVFLETMYKKHETSHVYLGIAGDLELLKDLQGRLASAISELFIAQPNKYLPHITIGKLKKMDPVMTKEVLQKIREIEIEPLPEFQVDSFSLYESLLSRDGSHFRRVSRYKLS